MVYFTADFHFGHENIIQYCDRPFKNAAKMDEWMTRGYNEVVKPEDTVYILGDFTLCGVEATERVGKWVKKLNGRKHLILGNHDRLKPFVYVDLGFCSVHTGLDWPRSNLALIHDPAVKVALPKERRVLCGHVHTLFQCLEGVVNVGVDKWFFRPVSIPEIEKLIGPINLGLES